MSLIITGLQCGQRFGVAPHLYGQRVNCTSCGGILDIPIPAPLAPATNTPNASRVPAHSMRQGVTKQKSHDSRQLTIILASVIGGSLAVALIVGLLVVSVLNRKQILPVDLDPNATVATNQIVFVSNRNGTKNIYSMDGRGENLRQLTNLDAEASEPCWSPNGKYIAFARKVGRQTEIFVMNSDGSNQQQLTAHWSTSSGPAWSPDGQRIAYHSWKPGNYDIRVVSLADGTVESLTTSERTEAYPSWSPDGRQLLFHRQEADGDDWNIYMMNADGSNERSLTTDPSMDWLPAWSPSGEEIAFWSTRSGQFELYVMTSDGENPQRALDTANTTGWISRPAWSPNGARIAISTDLSDYNLDIVLVGIDANTVQRLTDSPAEDSDPHWSP